jgi:hypothetical protein
MEGVVRLDEFHAASDGRVPLNLAISYVLCKPRANVAEWLSSHRRDINHKKANKNEDQRRCLLCITQRCPKSGNRVMVNGDDIQDIGMIFSESQKDPGILQRAAQLEARLSCIATPPLPSPRFCVAAEHPGTNSPLFLWQHLHPHSSCMCSDDPARPRPCSECVGASNIAPPSKQPELIRFGRAAPSFVLQHSRIGWFCPKDSKHVLCPTHLNEYIQRCCTSAAAPLNSSAFPFLCSGPGCSCPIPVSLVLLLPQQDHTMLAQYLDRWHQQRLHQQSTQLRAAVHLAPKTDTPGSGLFEQVFNQHRSFEDCVKDRGRCSADQVAEFLSMLLAYVLTTPCPACGTLSPDITHHGLNATAHRCTGCGILFCRSCRLMVLTSAARNDDLDGRAREALRQMGRTSEYVNGDHGCPAGLGDLRPVPQRLALLWTGFQSTLYTHRPDLSAGVLSSGELSPLLRLDGPYFELMTSLQPPTESDMGASVVASRINSDQNSGSDTAGKVPVTPQTFPRLLLYLARLGCLGHCSTRGNDTCWTIESFLGRYDVLLRSPQFFWNRIVPLLLEEPANQVLCLTEPLLESRPVIVQVDCTTLSAIGVPNVMDVVSTALAGLFDPADALFTTYCRSQLVLLHVRLVLPFRKCGRRDALIERCAAALSNAVDQLGFLSSRRELLTIISCPTQLCLRAGEEWHLHKYRCLSSMNQTELLQYMSAMRVEPSPVLEELKFNDACYPPINQFSTDTADVALMPILRLDRTSLRKHRPSVIIRPSPTNPRHIAIWWTVRCLVRGHEVTDPATLLAPKYVDKSWPKQYRELQLLDIRSYSSPYFIVRVWGSRFCASGRTEHSTCHPYFVVDGEKGLMHQHCMDEECRGFLGEQGATHCITRLTEPVTAFLAGKAGFPWLHSKPPRMRPGDIRNDVNLPLLQTLDRVLQGLQQKSNVLPVSTLTPQSPSYDHMWLVDTLSDGFLNWQDSITGSKTQRNSGKRKNPD